jgi:site-specific recombinase XerD
VVEELALLREESLSVHRRCRAVVDLLYSTGARLQEACAMTLEDVTDAHIVLRDTKRRLAASSPPGRPARASQSRRSR